MQFISISITFIQDYTSNGLIACNMILIIPGNKECKSNKKYVVVQFFILHKIHSYN